jgi:Big-like domain-containing protein/GlcNAc-PI de-N-acetylase
VSPTECLGRRHYWLAVVFVALWSIVMLGVASTAHASAACPAGASMNIVGHPDDDLLFQSPDILHDVQSGKCVRTVYVTAGASAGDMDTILNRESGVEAAYANMAGVANSWTTSDAGISGHPISLVTLAAKPTVSLAFLRLPEGVWGDSGTPQDPTIRNLWLGSISQDQAGDGSSAYTKSGLISTLTALMNGFQPDTIRAQDYLGTFGDGDHDDHHAAAFFAHSAQLSYGVSHTFIGYMDYDTENQPQNVFSPDLTAKTNAFYAYLAWDSAPCGDPPNCGNNEYSFWLKRQYIIGTETGGAPDTTPPTVSGVVPADGSTSALPSTAVTATFSETVDPATANTSTFTLRDANGSPVAASVSTSGSTVTLRPSARLAPLSSYAVTLTGGSSGIKDLAGNALSSNYTWAFTTADADVTPPTTALAFPAAGGAYNAAGWTAGCSPAGLCGTASDAGSGVQSVEVSILRSSTNRYWNGSTFGSTTERWFAATGTNSWGYALASLPGASNYVVRVRATDGQGNVSAPTSTTFTYDTTAPTFTVTFPAASGSYTTASWNAGCGVCGTAADAGSGVNKVEVSIRRGSGNYWNGTAFASSSEVFFPATGTSSWQYAFPAANFGGVKATYNIRVRATDNAKNVRAPTTTKITFTP